MNAPILLIFDIDGTLTDSGGLGRKALESAAYEIYGILESTKDIVPHGLTDFLIFERMLKYMDVQSVDVFAEFRRFCEVYVRHFASEIGKSKYPILLKGVISTLERLSKIDGIYLAVGTGNIRMNAEIKLSKQDIAKYFPVGGFGDGDFPRSEVIANALRNSQRYYDLEFSPENVWVIGDTPLDIEAGKLNGLRTVGVASSIFNEEKLQASHPDLVISSFENANEFLETILEPQH